MSGKQQTGRFYQPELDALRFFAFLGVFAHHKSSLAMLPASLLTRPLIRDLFLSLHVVGAYGVNLFFLLSSYLITRLLRKEVASSGALNLKAFYVRRALRIWPLYFFFLALGFILWRDAAPQGVQGEFFIWAMLFAGNWFLSTHVVFFPLILLWTISVEEQFYIAWPLLVRSARRERIVGISVAAIAVSQIALVWLRVHGAMDDPRISYNTLVQGQFFGLGALAALWSEERSVELGAAKRVLLLVGGLLFLLAATLFDARSPILSAGPVTYNISFCLIAVGVLCLFRAALAVPRWLLPGWLLYLGKISYGLYVFNLLAVWLGHRVRRWGVPLWGEFVATFGLNVLLAVVSYQLLEKPFLRLKGRFEAIRTRTP